MANKLKILVESRIRGNVYVRFGGEYMETYYSNIARHRVLSLHHIVTRNLLMQLFGLMNLTLLTTDLTGPVIILRGIPKSDLPDIIRERVQRARQNSKIVELN